MIDFVCYCEIAEIFFDWENVEDKTVADNANNENGWVEKSAADEKVRRHFQVIHRIRWIDIG